MLPAERNDGRCSASGSGRFSLVQLRCQAKHQNWRDLPAAVCLASAEWRLYPRCFPADVLDLVPEADKYIVRLGDLEAGRQEDEQGDLRPTDQYSKAYWAMVGDLVGRKITIAYEADDGRALYLRLATLTGEHNYFSTVRRC